MAKDITSRRAYAKLNLMLSVGQALSAEHQQAGYHPICSWFSCVDLFDDVYVERLASGASKYDIAWADDVPAERRTEIDWPIEKDLAVRAHKVLEAATKKSLPAAITVRKRIPVGGGLGGGSSDAAACLLALKTAFTLNIDDEALQAVATSLGSDVAFFLDDENEASDDQAPKPAIVSNLGDVIERVESVEYPIILVVPRFACATGAVYKAFDEALEAELREYRLDRAVSAGQGEKLGRERTTGPREQMVRGRVERMLREGGLDTDLLFNDLAKPAFTVEPRLGKLVTNLSNVARSTAHVTGSGSCVFLVPRRSKEEWMMERVKRVCEMLGSEPDFGGTPSIILTSLVG